MARKNKSGEWLDSRGKAHPENMIQQIDKRRDQTVEQIVKWALALQERMRKEKVRYYAKIDKHIAYIEKKLGEELAGKGNIRLTNFSGDMQVEVRIKDVQEFDERLHVAKKIIDGCLKKWSKGANQNLVVAINEAFDVDKAGNINKNKILSLRRWKVSDPDWKRAMEIISDSLNTTSTKQYLVIRKREAGEGKWKTINLNFSTIEC